MNEADRNKLGKNKYFMICAYVAGTGATGVQVDKRLQALRKKGSLQFKSSTGWTARTQQAST